MPGEPVGGDVFADSGEDVDLPTLKRQLRRVVSKLAKKATPASLAAISQLLAQLERLTPAAESPTTFIIESHCPRPPTSATDDVQAAPVADPGKTVPNGANDPAPLANDANQPLPTNVAQPATVSPAADPYTSREDLLATMTADAEDRGHVSDREIPQAAWRPVHDGQMISDALGNHGPGLLGGVADDV